MIRSFRNKSLQRFFETGNPRGLRVHDAARLSRVLRALDVAVRPQEMDIPGYRFHGLIGRDRGRYSVRITANWRLTFGWADEDAIDVDLEDYH